MVSATHMKGMAAYDKRDFPTAVHALEAALQQLAECDEDDSVLFAAILLGLGTAHHALRSHDIAMQYYNEALSALQEEGSISGDSLEIVSPLVNMGLIFYAKKDYVNAMAKYKRAQRIVERLYCTDRTVCADLYHNMGVVCDAQNELQKALQFYGKSLRVREKLSQTREQQLLLMLTKENVAMVWRDQDNKEEAVRAMAAVLPIRKKLNGSGSAEYGNSLFNMGLLHFDLGRLNSALTYFSKCLSLRTELLGESSSQTELCATYVTTIRKRTDRVASPRLSIGSLHEEDSFDYMGNGGGGAVLNSHVSRLSTASRSRTSRGGARSESPGGGGSSRRGLSLSNLARSPSPHRRGSGQR